MDAIRAERLANVPTIPTWRKGMPVDWFTVINPSSTPKDQ